MLRAGGSFFSRARIERNWALSFVPPRFSVPRSRCAR
jgi:hypothetical protein